MHLFSSKFYVEWNFLNYFFYFHFIFIDNHDVLSLVTYVDKDVMEKIEKEKQNKIHFEIAPANMSEEARVIR